MTISICEFEIRGIDACKWVIFFQGMQLPSLLFGSRMEAEMWVDDHVAYWNTLPKDENDK